MSHPVDELLSLLPDVGLRLVNLSEHEGADPWGAIVGDRHADPKAANNHFGQGGTPTEALVTALRAAGCDVEGL